MTQILLGGIAPPLPASASARAGFFFRRAFGAAPIREARVADSHCVGGSAWVLPRGRFYTA